MTTQAILTPVERWPEYHIRPDGTEYPRVGNWCQTFSGAQYWPIDPRPGDYSITDIAHHLSLINRYGGATKRPYSVASHSLLVAVLLDGTPYELEGLMHDAGEFMLGDMISPVKDSSIGARFKIHEKRTEQSMAIQFGYTYPHPAEVDEANRIALAMERGILLHPCVVPWGDPEPSNVRNRREAVHVINRVSVMKWETVKATFIKVFDTLVLAKKGVLQ